MTLRRAGNDEAPAAVEWGETGRLWGAGDPEVRRFFSVAAFFPVTGRCIYK